MKKSKKKIKTHKSSSKSAKKKSIPVKKSLRIAHIHWGFPPIIGGVETHLALMLPTFNKMGHETFLLTGHVDGVPHRHDHSGTKVVRTPLMDLNWLFKRGLAGLEEDIIKLFHSFVDETKPDLIHTHNMHYFSTPHAEAIAHVAKQRGIPLFLTAHNVWDDDLFLDLSRDVPWTHIIAVSHYIRREMLGIGIEDKRCSTIHHGIDHHMFNPAVSAKNAYKKYPILKGKKVIFHPARMGIAKGCDVSIKAFNIVHQRFPDTVLALAGTKNIIDWGANQQKDIAYFIRLVKFFNLEDSVLVDAYSLDQMPGLYSASDIVIYPSTAMEPFGLTMLEGMSTAKPLIVTKAGGMPEIIHDNINGFVIPIKDFEALAGRICRLLAEDRLRERLGRTGRQMIEERYTKEHMSQNHLNLYYKVLSGEY